MEHDAVACVGCGYNYATGEQAKREYTPVARFWDGGMPVPRRWGLFGAGQAFSITLLGGAVLADILVAGLISWVISSLLLAYILGTFARVEVLRTRGGNVMVTKRWHFCFVPLKPMRIQILAYEGVRVGVARDADLWDWVLFFILLGYGIIPGLIWWYCAFQRDLYYVGLLQNHGSVAVELYRGWNEAMARDMGQVIRDVGGFA
jgi:hypothetical protein